MDLLNLDEWLGLWSIERRFFFEAGGGPERFRGQATVSSARPGLYLYFEEGYLEGTGKPIHAVRRYWIRPGNGESLELRFAPDPLRPDDAPPFVTLFREPDGSMAGSHRCGEDLYSGVYRDLGGGSLAIEWTVEGPRKRGRILSELKRVEDEMGYP